MREWRTNSGQRICRVLGGRCNVFLVSNSRKKMLVDTSTRRNFPALLQALERLQVTGIDYLAVTHAHFDHGANAQSVKERYGARIVADKKGAGYLAAGRNEPTGGAGAFTGLLYKAGGWFLERHSYEPCSPDILVEGTWDLKEYGFDGRIIPTPGHSPYAISIILDDEIALVGDTLFGVFPWSVLPPWVYAVETLMASWEVLLQTGCTVFLPSHGNAIERDRLERAYARRRRGN